MNMLKEKEVEIFIVAKMINYYQEKGYNNLKHGNRIIVKVEDLPKESHAKLTLICDCCNEEIRKVEYREFYSKFLIDGYNCNECKKKKSFEESKVLFKSFGYELISDINDYSTTLTKLSYICHKHKDKGIMKTSTNQLKKGSGCKYCGIETASNKHRCKYEDVKELFKSKGLTLLSENYSHADQLLEFICDKHIDKGIQEIRYRAVKDGQGCKYCGREKASEKNKFTYEFVKSQFEIRDYEMLDNEYLGSRKNVRYTCRKHPKEIQSISFRALYNQGQGCRYCAIEGMSGENSVHWKGGISELSTYLRQFIGEWKINSFKWCNYKCFITNIKSDGKFEVHHLLSVNVIVRLILENLNLPLYSNISQYNENDLKSIVKMFISENNKIRGIVLHPIIHKLFHREFGYGCNNAEQFKEFMNNFNNNKYDNYLLDKGFSEEELLEIFKNNTMEQVLEFKQDYLNGKFDDVLSA